MNTEKTEDRDDHEMEELLAGARIETSAEEDARILGTAQKFLAPQPIPRRQLFLRVAAALLLVAGVGFGVREVFRLGGSDGPAGTSGPTAVVAMPPVNLPGADTSSPYRYGGGGGGAGNRSNGTDSVLNHETLRSAAEQRDQSLSAEIRTLEWQVREAEKKFEAEVKARRAEIRRGENLSLLPAGGYVRDLDVEVGEAVVPRSRLLPEIGFPTAGEWDRVRRLSSREERLPTTGEAYDRIIANPWHNPRTAPRSTFSVDVDSASYANIRRFLSDGQLPPADAVRIEEMINYFSYDYPQPEGDRPFSVVADAAECPWNPQYRLVRIGVQGRRIAQENTPPRNLVFLLDVSGSMQSEDKLPLVKSAMKLLVGELRPEDRVGIVTYASGTAVALEPTTGAERFRIIGAIDRLTAGGSTNAGSGIQLAYELARKHFEKGAINRVLLATDGDFNVGITDRAGLEALITKEREGGIFLTVLGVGTGNLKDSQMEMLADRGNGNYAYLDSILEAQKVLVQEAGATLVTIARDVKIQVEFNPARVAAYRLVGYENRMLAARDFNDDTKDAGEIGAGHSVTALYEVIPAGIAVPRPEIDPLRYQQPDADAEPDPEVNEDFGDEMLFLRLRYQEPRGAESKLLEFPLTDPEGVSINDADDDFAFAAAVALFGKILRNSPDTRELTLGLVEEIAAGAVGADENGHRREFQELVKTASKLGR